MGSICSLCMHSNTYSKSDVKTENNTDKIDHYMERNINNLEKAKYVDGNVKVEEYNKLKSDTIANRKFANKNFKEQADVINEKNNLAGDRKISEQCGESGLKLNKLMEKNLYKLETRKYSDGNQIDDAIGRKETVNKLFKTRTFHIKMRKQMKTIKQTTLILKKKGIYKNLLAYVNSI